MKLPKLYTKNEKGRYEEFTGLDADIERTVFKRINGKYIPWGRYVDTDTLTPGIWVVTASFGCKSISSGKYLRDRFDIDKISDVEVYPIAKLASMSEYCQYAMESVNKEYRSGHTGSMQELIDFVVGKVFEYSESLKNKEKENETRL